MSAAPINPVTGSLLDASMRNERNRLKKICDAFKLVGGEFEKPLKVRNQKDDNVVVNKLRPVVNVTTSFLVGDPPTIEVPAESDSEAATTVKSDLEAWLDKCLRANRWGIFLHDLSDNGAISGTPYARIDLPAEEGGFPRLTALDPSCMSITTDPRDIERVTSYWWTYSTYSAEHRNTITYRQRFDLQESGTWLITEEHSIGNPDAYVLQSWKQDKQYEWLLPWCPIVHCKNLPNPNQVYGLPDITDDLITLNKQINFNLSNSNKINRYIGHPQGWVKGVGGIKLDIAPDTFTNLGDKGEMGYVAPTLSEQPRTFTQDLEALLLERSATPAIVLAGRDTSQGNPSGIALRTELWPLLVKTDTKRELYGALIVEIVRRLFELGGHGSDILVDLTWPELIPSDPLAEAQALKMHLDMGIVSKGTVASKLGYSWDTEQANIEEERKAAAEAMRDTQNTAMAALMAGMGPDKQEEDGGDGEGQQQAFGGPTDRR